ncbi:hypothetical protein QX776_12490 [Alteromonadaceae bacterium BrNp21-10]|nr:hypothetical protein [Alteromonadaceae bacterium BrNp21-10]
MQPNKTKLALQIGAVVLGAVCASSVSADSFNLTVNTIQDVQIDTVQALDFGENITTDASQSCVMDADVPADADVFSDGGGAATTFGVITGAACIGSGTTVAQPGIYSIQGEAGLDVTLTLSTEAQAGGDYTFSPGEGCGVDHDGASGGDTCGAITVGSPITLTLADTTAGDDGPTVDGFTHFTVGGTLAIGATGLTSDTDYNATFLVNVVY